MPFLCRCDDVVTNNEVQTAATKFFTASQAVGSLLPNGGHPADFNSAWRDASEGGPVLGHTAGVSAKTWSNWAGNYKSVVSQVFAPATRAELLDVVNKAIKDGKKVRAAGSGHSWSPLSEVDDGYLVLVKNLRKVGPGPNNTVIAEPGALVKDLDAVLDAMGRSWPSTTVETTFTCGGIIAPGCHGSGKDQPLISDLVESVELVTYDGGQAKVMTVSETSHPEWLAAVKTNLGCLGIVCSIVFKTVADFMVSTTDTILPAGLLNDEATLRRLVMQHDYVDINWFPYQPEVWVKAIDKRPDLPFVAVSGEQKQKLTASKFVDWINVGMGRPALDKLADAPELTPGVCAVAFELIKATVQDRKDVVMPIRTALHYQDSCDGMPCRDVEYCFPFPEDDFSLVVKAWQAMLTKLKEHEARGSYPASLFGQLRFIRGSPPDSTPLLSPSIAEPGKLWCYIEVLSVANNKQWDGFAREMCALWDAIHPQAVPHWAKEFDRTPEAFARLRGVYGDRLTRFDAVRKALDPNGMFSNKYVTSIFGS